MDIAILFCRPTYHPFPIFAWGIMLFQKTWPWKPNAASHVVIRYRNNNVDMCTHITSKGVHHQPFLQLRSKYKVVRSYETGLTVNKEELCAWIIERRTRKYDKWQIVGFVITFLGLTRQNVFGSDLRKYICSEFAADFLATFEGWKLGDSDNWDLTKLESKLKERGCR